MLETLNRSESVTAALDASSNNAIVASRRLTLGGRAIGRMQMPSTIARAG